MFKQEGIIMAGFGGQGIMFMGMLLAHGGMLEGKEVTWMPSYGPEMRGGTANCTVIISRERIASPVIRVPDTLIAMNFPSLEKFEPQLKEGGLLLYNSSLINTPPERQDLELLGLNVNEQAEELGEERVLNMVALGAYLGCRPVVALESVQASLEKVLPEKRHHLIEINERALERGKSLAVDLSLV